MARTWHGHALWTPPQGARHVAHSPDLTRVAVLAADGTVTVVDPATHTTVGELHAPEAAWIAVSDKRELVATISAERQVHVRHASSPRPIALSALCGRRLRGHTTVEPEDLVFSPCSYHVIASSYTVDVDETSAGTLRGKAETRAVSWTTGAASLLSCDSAEVPAADASRHAELDADHVLAVRWSAHVDRAALIFKKDARVVLFDYAPQDDRWRPRRSPPHERVRDVLFAARGAALMLTRGPQVILWDIERAQEKHTLPVPDDVTSFAWASDGIAVVDPAGDVIMYSDDVRNPVPRTTRSPAVRVRLSPDVLRILCADGTVLTWH